MDFRHAGSGPTTTRRATTWTSATVRRSWDRHRVEPLTGYRHVLAVQWWIAPAHTDTRTGPATSYFFTEGPDNLLAYCEAILSPGVDPTSYYAAQICGKRIGRLRWNCMEKTSRRHSGSWRPLWSACSGEH